jgi:hypothetical protein
MIPWVCMIGTEFTIFTGLLVIKPSHTRDCDEKTIQVYTNELKCISLIKIIPRRSVTDSGTRYHTMLQFSSRKLWSSLKTNHGYARPFDVS